MEKVGLVGTKGFRYGGKAVEIGGSFDASRRDARLLVALGKASYAPAGMTAVRAPTPTSKPVKAKAAPKAAKPADSSGKEGGDTPYTSEPAPADTAASEGNAGPAAVGATTAPWEAGKARTAPAPEVSGDKTAEPTLDELRAEYKATTGADPKPTWDATRITTELAKLNRG